MDILIVNDDKVSTHFLKLMVERSNVARNVVSVENGQEAIDYLSSIRQDDAKSSYPCTILLDIDMPVMNGWEFLREFEANLAPDFPKIGILITSSTKSQEELRPALNYPSVKGVRGGGDIGLALKDQFFLHLAS